MPMLVSHLLYNLTRVIELLHHLHCLLYWLARQSSLHYLLTWLLTSLLVADQLTQPSTGHCDGPGHWQPCS